VKHVFADYKLVADYRMLSRAIVKTNTFDVY